MGSSFWSVTSDVPLPPAWAGGRETTALVTPDNHLWSLTVWPLPPSNSQVSLRHYLTMQAWSGGRAVGREGKRRGGSIYKEKLRAERTHTPPCLLPHVVWEGDTVSSSEEGWWADSRKNLQEGCENEHLKGAFGGATEAQRVSDSLKRALQEYHPFSHSHPYPPFTDGETEATTCPRPPLSNQGGMQGFQPRGSDSRGSLR